MRIPCCSTSSCLNTTSTNLRNFDPFSQHRIYTFWQVPNDVQDRWNKWRANQGGNWETKVAEPPGAAKLPCVHAFLDVVQTKHCVNLTSIWETGNNIKQRLSQLEWLDNAISKGLEIVPTRSASSDQIHQRAVHQVVPALQTPPPVLSQADPSFYWAQPQPMQMEAIVPHIDTTTYVHSTDHIADASQLQYNHSYPLVMSPQNLSPQNMSPQTQQPRIEDVGNEKAPSMHPYQMHHGSHSQSSLDKMTVDANVSVFQHYSILEVFVVACIWKILQIWWSARKDLRSFKHKANRTTRTTKHLLQASLTSVHLHQGVARVSVGRPSSELRGKVILA